VVYHEGKDLVYYLSTGADRVRFIERCGRTPVGNPSHRAAAFQSFTLMTLTRSERQMMEMGFHTRGLALEKNFCHLLAYHAFRELGPEGFSLRPEVEEATGVFTVLCLDMEKLRTLSFAVAIFDEIQYLKNPQTQGYQCAEQIKAGMKLGLTGTPIENRLQELKALLDRKFASGKWDLFEELLAECLDSGQKVVV
jgi:hypothetical protein